MDFLIVRLVVHTSFKSEWQLSRRLLSGVVLTAENLGTYPRCCAPNSLIARFSYLDVWRGAGSSAEIDTAVEDAKKPNPQNASHSMPTMRASP